jgi:ribonuclease BN (tRNA processing enzyme)
MKFVVLGSGSAVPHPKRGSSGYWLETAAGSILLDCSASAIQRMAQENLEWARLDAIWISHFHLDHCGGLAPFLFGTRNAPEMREREKPLKIYGAKGLKNLIESFDRANNYKLFRQPFPLEIIEVEPLEKFEILKDVKAEAFKTPHTGESLSIRIKHDAKTFVYSSDTGFDKTFRTFAKRADLLLLECSFFKNKTTEKHLNLDEAMYLIRHAKPKRAVLTHFYAEWDAVDFQTEVAKFAPACEVIEAYDGLTFNI